MSRGKRARRQSPDPCAAIRDALAKAFAAEVKRWLGAARLAGWAFPDECDVGIQVVESTALRAKFNARIDDVGGIATVGASTIEKDLIEIVEQLCRAWLDKRATRRPAA